MPKLGELARILRSKNAGPLFLTIDIMFNESQAYERVLKSKRLNKTLISKLYDVDAGDVSIIDYPAAYSIKITLPKKIVSGNVGDTDIYGAQQHAPLLDLDIE